MKFWFYFYLVLNIYEVYSQKTRYVILSRNMICTSWSSSDVQWTNFPSIPKKNILYQLPPSYLKSHSLDAHLAVYFYPHQSSILSFGDEPLHLEGAEILQNILPIYSHLIPTIQQMVLWTNEAIPKLRPVLEDVSEKNKKPQQTELTYKPLLKIRWHMDKSFHEIVPKPVLTKCAKKTTFHCIDTQLEPGRKRGNAIISYSRTANPTNRNIKWMAVVKPNQSKIELLYGSEVVLTIRWFLDKIAGPKISWVLKKNDAVTAQIRCFETRENGKLKLMCMVDRNDPPLDLSQFSFGKNETLEPTYQLKWFINSKSAQIKWVLYKTLKKTLNKQLIHNKVNQPNDEVSHDENGFGQFMEKHETYQDIGQNYNKLVETEQVDTSKHQQTDLGNHEIYEEIELDDKELLGEAAQGQNVNVETDSKHRQTGIASSEGGSFGLSIGGSLKLKNPLSGLLSGGKEASKSGGVGLAIGGALKYNKNKFETNHTLKENTRSKLKSGSKRPRLHPGEKFENLPMAVQYFLKHPKQLGLKYKSPYDREWWENMIEKWQPYIPKK
ncbi:uncharacterized protein LOC103312753 [Tribolium castaneum]|uniref:Uncharacterized protein n=1 Tax=Tribolium castaneum TaxID=7070 RepID=D2A2R6_TRICA|nr:PREDICTED: uncharacterized protein LOC103312753 [Tribolium castaneum]EFA01470.2 hypothetical protein TcasGA2_TC007018 [Tribolium castaneum]|eukprot:XP_008192412.1 PREDICTED: uncharacterized protein LOC103312753 [Tribolium castaneum]